MVKMFCGSSRYATWVLYCAFKPQCGLVAPLEFLIKGARKNRDSSPLAVSSERQPPPPPDTLGRPRVSGVVFS